MNWHEHWTELAECQDGGTNFFTEDLEHLSKEDQALAQIQAQVVCSACPVTLECLDYAIETKQMFGVWGMHSPADRRNLKRQMSRRPTEAERYVAESFVKIITKVESALDVQTSKRPTLASV